VRGDELPITAALAAPRRQKLPVRVELLDAVVESVDDVEAAIRGEGDAA
jgi:hypothetical protein